MMQRLFRGQSEAADAIGTAADTLDAALEDAQTERDALEQYDALQQQISELWGQADEIGRQMYELDEAMSEAAEIGGGAVTVQVYSRDRSRRRAEGDEDIRRQLEELNRKKGDVIRRLEDIEKKYGLDLPRVGFIEELRNDLDTYEELEVENDELSEQMQELLDEAPDIDGNDFEWM